jgi:hypothetical protein
MVPDFSVLGLLTVRVASMVIEKVFVAVFEAESVTVMAPGAVFRVSPVGKGPLLRL